MALATVVSNGRLGILHKIWINQRTIRKKALAYIFNDLDSVQSRTEKGYSNTSTVREVQELTKTSLRVTYSKLRFYFNQIEYIFWIFIQMTCIKKQ